VIILDLLTTLVIVTVIGVLVIGLLAPVESLGWWAGWSGEPPPGLEPPIEHRDQLGARISDPVVIYLSGIGSISGDELLAEEAEFLDRLGHELPGSVIVRDVFPYSVRGVGLTGARSFAQFWQLLDRLRAGGNALLSSLINVRNLFQVAVAADPRYGAIFSYGVAQVVARSAIAAGYRRDAGQPLVILGYSGGAQVAVGVAPFLRQLIGARVHVISLGGVLNSEAGLSVLSRFDHLVGERDVMERIGRYVYFGRWPIARSSAWNLARRAGVVHIQRLPDMTHNTPGGYMDAQARTSTGQSNPEWTAQVVAAAVRSTATGAAR
jgi:hypothetical protein